MAEGINLEQSFHKLPRWGWVAGAVGAGLLFLWYSRQQQGSSSTTTSTTTLPGSTDQAPNTSTPTGGPACPSYSMPSCSPPGVIIFEADDNGCQKPVCSTSLSGGGGTPAPTTACHSSQHGGHCTVGQNCPGMTLRQIFTAEGQDVNCALLWNPTAINRGLDGQLWTTPVPFVVYY